MQSRFSHVRVCATPWTVAPRLLCPRDSPGQNPGVVAMPSSKGSSGPRNRARISCVSCSGRQVPYSATYCMHQVSAQQIPAIRGDLRLGPALPPSSLRRGSRPPRPTAGPGRWALEISAPGRSLFLHTQLRSWLCPWPRLQAGGSEELDFSDLHLRPPKSCAGHHGVPTWALEVRGYGSQLWNPLAHHVFLAGPQFPSLSSGHNTYREWLTSAERRK